MESLDRWSGFGPYYAMFPMDFAMETIATHTVPGDWVLDPFAGRGTSIFASAALGRNGQGVEIHPLGWLYGNVKLFPAEKKDLLIRLKGIGDIARRKRIPKSLPEFYGKCFSPVVIKFLLAARNELLWKANLVDATLMSFILVYLHGKTGQALSNQMRQTKAMSPDYSIRWWKERKMVPPDIDPVEFLKKRIEWRYKNGQPDFIESGIALGDSTKLLKNFPTQKKFSLLLTSPPYWGVTDYHYDQWLRLWMLGYEELPHKNTAKWCGKFDSKIEYQELLDEVFSASAKLLKPDATVYVRTDARQFTAEATVSALKKAFPDKELMKFKRPFQRPTQTALYGDKTTKPGELDIILKSRS
jgi:hypothetical protein